MKSFSLIQQKQIDLMQQRRQKELQHSELSKIDMLSASGEKLREELNNIKGWEDALNWVIDDRLI